MIKGRNNRLATSGLAVLLSSISLTGCVSDPETIHKRNNPYDIIDAHRLDISPAPKMSGDFIGEIPSWANFGLDYGFGRDKNGMLYPKSTIPK